MHKKEKVTITVGENGFIDKVLYNENEVELEILDYTVGKEDIKLDEEQIEQCFSGDKEADLSWIFEAFYVNSEAVYREHREEKDLYLDFLLEILEDDLFAE